MESNDGGNRENRAAGPRSHLFTVRLRRERKDGGPEYRGSARDVVSGAFRNFREWPDLVAFMTERLEENEEEGRRRR